MVKGLWVAKALRERGLLLQILRESCCPVDTIAVRGAMASLGTAVDRDHFGRHLDYLEEKGYLRLETKRMGRLTVQLAEITALGRDLLMGVIDDPAVNTDLDGASATNDEH